MSNVRVVCGFSGSAVRAAWFDALVFLIRCESLLQAHFLSIPLSLLLSSCSHQSPEAAAAPGHAQQFIYYATALRQRVQNFKLKVHACECDGNKNFCISVCGISATRNGQHWQDCQPSQMGITLAANLANLCGKQRNLKSANICDNWQGAPSMCVCVCVCVCVCLYVCLLSYCSCKCWCTKRDLHDKLPNAREYLMHCVTWVNKDENKESLWARKAFEIRFYYAHSFIKKWEPKNSLKYDSKTFIFQHIKEDFVSKVTLN